MSTFRFFETKKSFEVQDKDGKPIQTYYIDVGNIDKIKEIMTKFGALSEKFKTLNADSPTPDNIDTIVEQQKEIVSFLIGDWEILFEECNKNVFAMMALVNALIALVGESVNEHNERLRGR